MASIKAARIRFCQKCVQWHSRGAFHWQWPRCSAGDPEPELDDGFMEGPESNCPLALWAALKPVDDDAERAVSYQRYVVIQTALWKKIVDNMAPEQMDLNTIRTKLGPLVADGIVLPETAEELETYVSTRTIPSA